MTWRVSVGWRPLRPWGHRLPQQCRKLLRGARPTQARGDYV